MFMENDEIESKSDYNRKVSIDADDDLLSPRPTSGRSSLGMAGSLSMEEEHYAKVIQKQRENHHSKRIARGAFKVNKKVTASKRNIILSAPKMKVDRLEGEDVEVASTIRPTGYSDDFKGTIKPQIGNNIPSPYENRRRESKRSDSVDDTNDRQMQLQHQRRQEQLENQRRQEQQLEQEREAMRLQQQRAYGGARQRLEPRPQVPQQHPSPYRAEPRGAANLHTQAKGVAPPQQMYTDPRYQPQQPSPYSAAPEGTYPAQAQVPQGVYADPALAYHQPNYPSPYPQYQPQQQAPQQQVPQQQVPRPQQQYKEPRESASGGQTDDSGEDAPLAPKAKQQRRRRSSAERAPEKPLQRKTKKEAKATRKPKMEAKMVEEAEVKDESDDVHGDNVDQENVPMEEDFEVTAPEKQLKASSSEAADKIATLNDLDLSDMRNFLMSAVPKEAGIVQCYIERNKSGSRKMFPEYHVFLKQGDRFLMASKKRAKNRTSNYVISMKQHDISRESSGFLGKLRSNFLGTEFTIYDKGLNPKNSDPDALTATPGAVRQELGVCTYASNVLGSRGPRKMKVAVPEVDQDGQRIRNWQPTRQGDQMLTRFKDRDLEALTKLTNKPPRWNESVGAYVLNFSGRVTMASVKNFQLVTQEDQESITLQFGRVGKDLFTMDFQFPLSPFQAFAICLSSFDSKLACE